MGAGGFEQRRGAVITRLVETLQAVTGEVECDVVLVVNKRADYAAIQKVRREAIASAGRAEESWGAPLEALTDRRKNNGLVLFIGSGASAGAGFETWDDLLKALAGETDLDDELRQAVSARGG